MEYAEVLFYIAEITLVLSYSVTRMILLRFMACAADIGYIAAALLIGLDEAGMKPTFIFAIVAFFVNAVHIYRLLKMRLPATGDHSDAAAGSLSTHVRRFVASRISLPNRYCRKPLRSQRNDY